MSGARDWFIQEISQPKISLARVALAIALEEYPHLRVEDYLKRLDTMATEIVLRLPPTPYPLKVIQTINRFLYDELGYQGNEENYYDPRNSFLNDVMDRRTGIPISMALVYLEIAERIGFPMVGVGMPGHFLIRPDLPEVDFFVDAFHRGEILFAQDCEERLVKLLGKGTAAVVPREPFGPRPFLLRLLANLKGVYLYRRDLPRTLAVVERMVLLFPDAAAEIRDRGILYARLSRWQEALVDLETYTTQLPHAPDYNVICDLKDQCRRHLLERMLE